ncbi:uncharacterized protein LOC127032985 isoform X2 [Gopherus flavomarginatus]|nr:uncharacterized protein LOC127032985 isoform X2 [Gopherus flavomarginatus]
MFKKSDKSINQGVQRFFQTIWHTSIILNDLKKGFILPFIKKGSKAEGSNYRDMLITKKGMLLHCRQSHCHQKLQWCSKTAIDGNRLDIQLNCLKNQARDLSRGYSMCKEAMSLPNLP